MGALVILGVVAFLVGLPVLGTWLEQRGRRSPRLAIEQRRITAIAALREGEAARIRGVVAAREPLLTSAIGGQPCVGFRATINEKAHDPPEGWSPLVSRERWSSFLVTDETGTVVVEGRLEVLLDPDDGGFDLPPAAYALLEEDQVRMRDLWGPRSFRFQERLLRVGDRVSVVGRPSPVSEPARRDSPREPSRQHVMRGLPYEPVVVMDDDEAISALLAPPAPVVPLEEAPPAGGPSRRAVEQRERTAIAALEEGGVAKVRGVVGAREPLSTSPVSGRACVGYRITIHQRPEGAPAENGVLVVRREAWPSFLVTDETGTAAVEGPFSILLDPDDSAWTSLPPSVYALLEEAKVPLEKEFLFRETLLAPGDRVAVVGCPSLEIDPAGRGSFRDPPRLYVLRGSEADPVAVIDDEEPVD
ncbi:MAG TPA: hypothetical protein VIF57_31890 [Polyangia bacterium]